MTLTDNAVKKIKDLIAEENNPDINLRVFVEGGGCSGMQYGFTFDEIKMMMIQKLKKTTVIYW